MGETSSNGKGSPRRRSKPGVPAAGVIGALSRERDFEVTATVTIRCFGDPDKETHKTIKTLRHIVDLAFPDAQVDSEIVLP